MLSINVKLFNARAGKETDSIIITKEIVLFQIAQKEKSIRSSGAKAAIAWK